jgi:hypothetical protein
MGEDLLRQLPEEYAGLANRRAVMHEAAEIVDELDEAVTRLGDGIIAAGLPVRAWRSQEAELRVLSGSLPATTVDGFLTRLAEFSADVGPQWLHGEAAALESFHAEVALLHEVIRSLGSAAQRMRAAPAHQRVLLIEVAFGNQRVVTAIEEVTLALSDLQALAPFMGPLTAEEWAAPRKSAVETDAVAKAVTQQVPTRAAHGGEPTAGTPVPGDDITLRLRDTTNPPAGDAPTIRLRDTGTKPASDDGKTLRLREYARTAPIAFPRLVPLDAAPTEQLVQRSATARQRIERLAQSLTHALLPWLESLPRRVQALVRRVRLPVRLVALLGLVLLLSASVLVLGQLHAGQAQPVSTLVVSPTRLALACERQAWAALTLHNPTVRSLTWQAQIPPMLTVAPTHGILAAGRTVMLRIAVVRTHPRSGTITITALPGDVAVPYTLACS